MIKENLPYSNKVQHLSNEFTEVNTDWMAPGTVQIWDPSHNVKIATGAYLTDKVCKFKDTW